MYHYLQPFPFTSKDFEVSPVISEDRLNLKIKKPKPTQSGVGGLGFL